MNKILKTEGLAWKRGKKTKGIKAKALINLLVDRTIVNKFLIDTLEGREPIDSANIFCIGEAGDAWQQTSKALLKKYNVTAIDNDGWMICEPKLENEVQFIHLTDELLLELGTAGDGYIIGHWGETIKGVTNLQSYLPGDYMCRQTSDPTDQWIVRRVLFVNTYTELGNN